MPAGRRRRLGIFSPGLYARSLAVRRGVLGNERFWRYVAVVLFGHQLLRKILGNEPQLLTVERLKPGQSVQIEAHPAAETAAPPELVRVLLRNPRREIDVDGPRTVGRLLEELGLGREAHLVIRNGTLVPGDACLEDSDTVEIRPVISGGS